MCLGQGRSHCRALGLETGPTELPSTPCHSFGRGRCVVRKPRPGNSGGEAERDKSNFSDSERQTPLLGVFFKHLAGQKIVFQVFSALPDPRGLMRGHRSPHRCPGQPTPAGPHAEPINPAAPTHLHWHHSFEALSSDFSLKH